ncbi:right-handed parallel beta-helix repeat-containing protein [Spongiactinospora sp. TRM90649]|uniref:right-handed parallel beta-helix repeat-containing protein n=1 Tax=Spongiactinospora sp. TRM90649 TaxID=3031114 RepID=UPI0023F79DC8|nr:right-handed parallel beta-helix repeat-containing protein [Spongiactinospora sp. TRM90649]MDF5757218.1 right-handed parallel beta-helix repeat-containing protein [Spongiactinospora sp. TRM90649]
MIPLRLRALTLVCALAAALAVALPARAHALVVNCGDTLTGSVTLTADLTCAGHALTVDADNVTIDLNGHEIIGNGTGNAITVRARKGISVSNGVIRNFANGVHASFGSTVVLTGVRLLAARIYANPGGNVTATGSLSTCAVSGASMSLRSLLVIQGCRVTGTLSLSESGGSAIRDSVLTDGEITLFQTGGSTFTGNVFDDFPVYNGHDLRSNLWRENEFKNAATAFIARPEYRQDRATIVENNFFHDNDIGLHGDGTRNVIVRNNFFALNGTAGMYLTNDYPMVSPDALSGNVFVDNGRSPSGLTDPDGNSVRGGIHIRTTTADPVRRITIAGNSGSGNGGYMIWAPPGMVVDGGGNQGPCLPTPNPDLTCY